MAGYVVLGMLAAFGLLSVFWAVLGWLLPAGKGCVLVCAEEPDEGILSRCCWLRDLGLLRIPFLIVSEEQINSRMICGMETIRPEELYSRLKEERCGINGTGNGDPPGRHQRRGVSEL